MFDVFYMGSNPVLQDNFPFAKQVTAETEIQSKTKMYWLIEPNVELTDYDVLEYRPPDHDQIYEHVWKWDSRNYGGVKLLPKRDPEGLKEVNRVVCKKRFDILNTKTPGKYFDKNPYATHVWCVDPDYKLADNIDWAPDNSEPNFVHSFHLRGQLEDKYPDQEGGVKLYPRDWKGADIKYHKFLDAAKTYPVMFVKDPEDYSQRDVHSDDYVWLIDQEHRINPDSLDWVPNLFEDEFIHSFRMPYQLTEKSWSFNHHENDPRLGGIRLVPRNWRDAFDRIPGGIVIHPDCPVEDENYDVFYTNKKFDTETFAYYAKRADTEWFWVIDRDYDFNGKLLYVPAEHERDYIHVFKWGLEYRYPAEVTETWDERVGGIYLLNKNYDPTKIKLHTDIVPVRYDIFYTDAITDYERYARRSRTENFWLVDRDYQLADVFTWVPPASEQKFILTFKISGQLEHKYPKQIDNPTDNRCGGIKLVPVNYHEAGVKFIPESPVKTKTYPILYVEDVNDYSIVTTDCWLVDKEYQINDDIDWIPSAFEVNSVHAFHVGNQLRHKYPEAMGGVRWVPFIRDGETVIHKDLPVKEKRYPMLYVDSPDDYSQARGECWLIDRDYIIDQEIEWIPSNFEKSFIHTFHVDGQLTHKYPEKMGGVRWIPLDWQNAETKIHGESPFSKPVFEKYTSESEGREKTTKDWFWVINPNVKVHKNFEFNFVPAVWDAGKSHVWQKLNPVTKRQYDYDGVMLCPKEPLGKGRPKYITEPACTHKMFPVCELSAERDIIEQLEEFDAECTNTMYWVTDPYTRLHPDFKFDYYPTQWDSNTVHVFLSGDETYKNVRLYPRGTFVSGHNHTQETVLNNTFEKLKQINTVASIPPRWLDVTLVDMTRDELVHHIKTHQEKGVPFFWTIDADVDVDSAVLDEGFLPSTANINKVHLWQRCNPKNGLVHSYGGVRLWPTSIDTDTITTETVLLNKIKGIQYVRKPGSYYKPFDVAFISYKEPSAQKAYDALSARTTAHWIKDVQGIFEAHKAAAQAVSSKMFWVVDADAQIDDDFDFSYIPDQYDQEVVHVWESINPITNDRYGYGGVKLFNREQILDADNWGLDFTTGLSKRFKAMPEVSCITKFNTDAYSTWRSAFRECCKLGLKSDTDSKNRLDKWLNPENTDADFVEDAVQGAQDAVAYVAKYGTKPLRMSKINDYDWLKDFYDNRT